uniref:Uncharacterized protein n=1 Tax=Ditylenchus dipsaci TaxID=166011 RepID=A0A915D330_9BILA
MVLQEEKLVFLELDIVQIRDFATKAFAYNVVFDDAEDFAAMFLPSHDRFCSSKTTSSRIRCSFKNGATKIYSRK